MNKTKVTKYKLVDTDISKDIAKKIVGKQFIVERVKTKGGLSSDGGRKPGSTNKITLAKLAEQMTDLTKTVKDGFAEQAKFNKQQLEFNKSIREDLNRIVKLNNLKH